MRINIVIDKNLMEEALKDSQIKTKKGAIEEGLHLLIQRKKKKRVINLRGNLKWRGDLEQMRTNDN